MQHGPSLEGEVERSRTWSLAELKDSFEVVTVTAILECAGNGRSGFAAATDRTAPWDAPVCTEN